MIMICILPVRAKEQPFTVHYPPAHQFTILCHYNPNPGKLFHFGGFDGPEKDLSYDGLSDLPHIDYKKADVHMP